MLSIQCQISNGLGIESMMVKANCLITEESRGIKKNVLDDCDAT